MREDLGFPPLVTPTSQIVGTQAVLNVLMGERYKIISQEIKRVLQGHVRPAAGADEPGCGQDGHRRSRSRSPCDLADLLEPGWEQAKEEIGDLAQSEEDIMSYALFPQAGARVL